MKSARARSVSAVWPLAVALSLVAAPLHAQGGLVGRMKAKVEDKLQKKADSTADTLAGKAFDKVAGAVSCVVSNRDCIAKARSEGKPVIVTDAQGRRVSSADSAQAVAVATGGAAAAGSPGALPQSGAPTIQAYQNYDFVPGDSIVFEDDFRSDTDGEFPAHWKLVGGQGVVNMRDGAPAFVINSGLESRMAPRIKSESYLGSTFTVEFDYYVPEDRWSDISVFLKCTDNKEARLDLHTGMHLWGDCAGPEFSGKYPGPDQDYANKWHHAAFVVKNGQFKGYIDQHRVLIVPDFPGQVASVMIGGRADEKDLITFKNVRIANGGAMTLIDKLTRDGRIVTHGIQFDVNKSDVKPQSMGTIRQIVALLNGSPALKLEIDGHTDSDGDPQANLALSQARADAVKQLLVEQGVAASRLTTKGLGATKPIAPNTTPEGKANNRRVELVKVP
jgi:OmpA-OmpF porin, OOP family